MEVSKEFLFQQMVENHSELIISIINKCYEKFGEVKCAEMNFELEVYQDQTGVGHLSEDDWYDLIYEMTPEIYDSLNFYANAA